MRLTAKRLTIAALLVLGLVGAACNPPSTGDRVVAVPNVVGMDYDQAKATLEQSGFRVELVDKRGQVIGVVRRQKPEAGYLDWGGGGVVRLVVASRY